MRMDMTSDIRRELRWAREALAEGNRGKARTCARRAVGIAATELQRIDNAFDLGTDFISQIRSIAADNRFPGDIRAAASRLQSRISQEFTSASIDPIHDAEIVLSELMKRLGGDQARSSER